MASKPNNLIPYATRANTRWSAELETELAECGIQVINHWPAAEEDWDPTWGDGNVFIGFRTDPAQMVLRVFATSEGGATAEVMAATGLKISDFAVHPQFDLTA